MSDNALKPAIPFSAACLGIATFAAMDAMMKGLAIEMGTYNAMLWRTGIAALLALSLFAVTRSAMPPRSSLKIHIWRGTVTSIMAYLFFWGLIYVPLAEAIALSFIAPLIALYLAAIILGEKIGKSSVLASFIGLAGAAIIVQGKLSGDYTAETAKGVVAILVSAALYAYNLILQRQQALIAKPVEISLFQNATVVAVYLVFAPFLAVVPSPGQWMPLTLTAVLGVSSLMLLSWAYARAEAKNLIPVEYTAFVWACLFGWLGYGETLTMMTLAGTALIVFGCLLAAFQHPDDVEHIETTVI